MEQFDISLQQVRCIYLNLSKTKNSSVTSLSLFTSNGIVQLKSVSIIKQAATLFGNIEGALNCTIQVICTLIK